MSVLKIIFLIDHELSTLIRRFRKRNNLFFLKIIFLKLIHD